MAPYIADEEFPAFIKVDAQDLFDFDRLEITEENEKTVKFICNCKSIAWPPFSTEAFNEHTAFLQISQKLFVPLCCDDQVILDKTYTKYLHSLGPGTEGLRACNIGCRSFLTWHGSPDARVRGTEVIYTTTEENTTYTMDPAHNSDDSNISNGLTTVVEAKLQWNKVDMPQLVSTCVVSSFTKNNLHSDCPSIVPAILIDVNRLIVCLYDCTDDV